MQKKSCFPIRRNSVMHTTTSSPRKSLSKYGSILIITAFAVIPALTVGMINYFTSLYKNYETYNRQIADEMQKLDDLTRIITESMNEMSAGAVQINNAVQEVNEITKKNKRSIESLAEEMDKFKVS